MKAPAASVVALALIACGAPRVVPEHVIRPLACLRTDEASAAQAAVAAAGHLSQACRRSREGGRMVAENG